MANIFSGVFNRGPGNAAGKLAEYNQELEEYGYDLDSYRQDQAVTAMQPGLEEAMKNMTPERQAQIKLQMMMMGEQPTFNKGIEGFNTNLSQGGGTIADMLKQEKLTAEANKRQLYKKQHPTGETTNKKIETAKWYMSLDQDKKAVARDAWRDRQFVDTKTGFQNVYGPQFIEKELIRSGVDTARAPIITERLMNFYTDIDATEDFLITFENQRKDIQKLYGMTPDNTGWDAIFNMIPTTDAHAWMNLRDTVVSNIGLSKILELKASSSQGATGLGALNEAELKMLQDHLGNLAQTNNPEDIQRILKRMDGDMQRLVDRKIRNARQQRAWYDRNKTYMGLKPGTADLILPEQEYMFSREGYNKPISESLLGTEESTEDRMKRYE